jgi:hypothetical protein
MIFTQTGDGAYYITKDDNDYLTLEESTLEYVKFYFPDSYFFN